MKKDLKDIGKVAAGMYVANRIQERRQRKQEERKEQRESLSNMTRADADQAAVGFVSLGGGGLVGWCIWQNLEWGFIAGAIGGVVVFFGIAFTILYLQEKFQS